MSRPYKHGSGHQKRKKKEELEKKRTKLPKIEGFLTSRSRTAAAAADGASCSLGILFNIDLYFYLMSHLM